MSAQTGYPAPRSEERKASRPPPPIVEAHLITQHGQGGQEVEEAPSYNENLISFEPIYREEDVANIEVVDLQRTPRRYTRQAVRPSEQASIYSDSGSVWEDVRSLQSELRRKRREFEEVRRRCVVAETAMQNGKSHSEHIKSKLLEEELEKVRLDLRRREREVHGQSGENEAAEKQHLRTMLGHKDHENQLLSKELAGLRSEKLKLKERVEAMWRDYEKYKTQHEGILRSLEKERQGLLDKLNKRDPDLSRAEVAEKEARITVLETQLAELRAQLHSREERVDQLQSLVEELQRDNQALRAVHEPPPEEAQLHPILSQPESTEELMTVQPEQTYPEDPRPRAKEPGPEITPVTALVEEVSLEGTHPSQEEAKLPVRHGEEAAGAQKSSPHGPESTKAEETKEEGDFTLQSDPSDLPKAESPPARHKHSTLSASTTAEEDFFTEMQMKGLQDRRKAKPFTTVPNTLFD